MATTLDSTALDIPNELVRPSNSPAIAEQSLVNH